MENEFTIVNGVLKRYDGDGGNVVIPDGVEKVAEDAFFNKNIKSITVPVSLNKINGKAFYNCESLEKLIVAEGHPTLRVAGNCIIDTQKKTVILGLKNSVIPDDGSIKKIGADAFTVNGLDNLVIPDGVTDILSYAFSGCEAKELVIPSCVKKIGTGAFSYCEFLERVELSEGVRSIGREAFAYCGMYSVKLPQSLTEIGEEAFSMCRFLEAVNIPSKLVKIGDLAFNGCDNMNADLIIPACLTGVNFSTFTSAGIKSITVEEGHPELYSAGNCLIERESKKIILGCPSSVIPDDGSVTEIDTCAFTNCRGHKSLVIPEGIVRIGSSAFSHCKEIESVFIPRSVTHIGHDAFWYCENLKTVTSPKIFSERYDVFYSRKGERIEFVAYS